MGVGIHRPPSEGKSRDRNAHHTCRDMDVIILSLRCRGCPEGIAIVSCVSKRAECGEGVNGGGKYADGDDTALPERHDIQPSMSRIGNSHGNAKTATLKHEVRGKFTAAMGRCAGAQRGRVTPTCPYLSFSPQGCSPVNLIAVARPSPWEA